MVWHLQHVTEDQKETHPLILSLSVYTWGQLFAFQRRDSLKLTSVVIQQTQRRLDQVSGTLLGQYFSSVKKRFFIWDETHLHHQQCLYILFWTSWINHYSLWSVQMENTADTVLPSASSSQYCQQTPKHFRDATCCVYTQTHWRTIWAWCGEPKLIKSQSLDWAHSFLNCDLSVSYSNSPYTELFILSLQKIKLFEAFTFKHNSTFSHRHPRFCRRTELLWAGH